MKCILVFLFLLASFSAYAQDLPGGEDIKPVLGIEATVYYGSIWRHTPKLRIETGSPRLGQEIGIHIRTRGRRAWQVRRRYPAMGVSFSHFYLGENAHGRVFGMTPYLTLPILSRSRWQVEGRIATGIGYAAHPYDAFSNPIQNALGSHWNNMTQFRLGASFRLTRHWLLETGASLTHVSNGATTLPNYGVNLPGNYLSARHSFRNGAIPKRAERQTETIKQRFGAQVTLGWAAVEYIALDGPRYPIRMCALTGMYRFNPYNRLLLGLDYEYNEAVYEWGLHSFTFAAPDEARRGATRLALTVGDEFMFGALGIGVSNSWYVGQSFNQLVLGRLSQKLALRYYVAPSKGCGFRVFAGLSLKAQKFIAEYIALTGGVEL